MDGARCPGAAALHKRSDKMGHAAAHAIILASANGLNPESDRATQIRLSAAIDRQVAGRASTQSTAGPVARAIIADLYLQEAAAQRLEFLGSQDPLRHVSNPASARDSGSHRAHEILNRNSISPQQVFEGATVDDLQAIAAGRYHQIKADRTRHAVASVLHLSEAQVKLPTMRVPPIETGTQAPVAAPSFPSATFSSGPRVQQPVAAFGRRGLER
ncbi:hypothetical protein [Sphingosinicella sp. BN140058]|uniref:hypothetical protein n=1 Tax=Sphingosinicella sp. BN140058 TaxID=1892855 RepID=UPI0010134696|nr:hypothetical protein [Sphingosinicella sp. BN140058]QAY80128.1 hypothetical protein ETR14_26155 [Sphingosinicella sp. BN140058]